MSDTNQQQPQNEEQEKPLTDKEMETVAGGLNHQPLPPLVIEHF